MQSRASLLTLVEELEGDMRELDRARALNERAWRRIESGADDALDWGALGYTLHSAYGIIENYCLRISKHFENNLDKGSWHKALIERMAIEVPGVRPALLREPGLKRSLLEIMKFRHRFRNLYGEELDPGKTAEIQKVYSNLGPAFRAAHGTFVSEVRAIAESL
jgi:hypothetical protein